MGGELEVRGPGYLVDESERLLVHRLSLGEKKLAAAKAVIFQRLDGADIAVRLDSMGERGFHGFSLSPNIGGCMLYFFA